jgi:predicted nuclease of predicted toxin-antitoxin system
MARLYANENFPRQVVEFLRVLGHDVLTVQEAGNAYRALPDEDVLAFASEESRAVLTLNRRDFVRLHMALPTHAGIIVCTQDADAQGQAERIHRAIEGAEELNSRLIRINRPQA